MTSNETQTQSKLESPVEEVASFLIKNLEQTEAIINSLPNGAYAHRVDAVGGSIGGHVRHCVEHIENILQATNSGEIFFENRQRDSKVAEDPAYAMALIRTLRGKLQSAAASGYLDRPVMARTSLTGDLQSAIALPSTLVREMVYVGLHFVHHLALVATAARLMGCEVDLNLGKAPATLHYEAGLMVSTTIKS